MNKRITTADILVFANALLAIIRYDNNYVRTRFSYGWHVQFLYYNIIRAHITEIKNLLLGAEKTVFNIESKTKEKRNKLIAHQKMRFIVFRIYKQENKSLTNCILYK